MEELVGVITSLVEPDRWHCNGGVVAQVLVVNGKMFIEAPPRMHRRTAWILHELQPTGRVGARPEFEPRATKPASAGKTADRVTGIAQQSSVPDVVNNRIQLQLRGFRITCS